MSKITIRGSQYIVTSPSWWMDAPIENKCIGGVEVARVHAVSATADGDGDPVGYMIPLTEHDLIEHNLTPSAPRPVTHDKVIVSAERYQKSLQNLQAEGEADDEIIDNSLWQKGDDYIA